MQKPIPIPLFLPGQFEFHIARSMRKKYQLDEAIFSISGNAILPNFRAARTFTQHYNDQQTDDAKMMKAGQLNAMGLIDEILHLVIGLYKQQKKPKVMAEAIQWLNTRVGTPEVDAALQSFAEQFPTVAVYRGEQTAQEYFDGKTDGIPNKQIILEEMLMLWLANVNPAFSPFLDLFDDADLTDLTAYAEIIKQLDAFFNYQPTFGPQNQQLIAMLRSPAQAHPHSLTDQLSYIRQFWAALIGEYLLRLLSSMDMIAEEEKAVFGGHGPVEVYDFAAWGLGGAPEQFSPDSDWMPRLVLLAKNAFVWLDQLSKQYRRQITRLDQIPDEELDRIAGAGITGLWLIGLWRRGNASRKIKQMMGDPDAIASAYSLDDYIIADELGGPEAAAHLRDRAIRRGIRLGGDMVPNHMAIDSRWVIEHPHWFLDLEHCPYPGYTFNGPNLSSRDGVGIYLEDHYYNRSDAAVVFKRVDMQSGEARYIYHGNDGTNMPWNDTAQLNFLLPEVREGVIQTILHVARQFPIIRFDAAMTLAKKHIQRLWFPEPGSGGAIPSRAEHGMTNEEFNRLIPKEFWREVVDRVAEEVPDTLLLAEAFWMMEGYFVRTLGMHRVYNSAFMHMLRDEENAKYRQLIKSTLEFNPQILKRYVNFMNNPDEETAVEQFGKGDKYFGVATLMATLPGLPMVGHGQIEGYSEKYGMEFQRAKWSESPDQGLIERHQRQLFPLFHRRRLFAEVENFLLYDFYTPTGYVNEDVFAYSNRMGDQRTLVVYHNRFGDTRGWVKTSAATLQGKGEESQLVQRSLAEGLGLPNDPNAYVIFRNVVDGMEYIRSCAEVHDKGIFFELHAYHAYVFIDFHVVYDAPDGRYNRVHAYLGGKPANSVDEALQEMFLQVIHQPYRELVNHGMVIFLIESRQTSLDKPLAPLPIEQVGQKSLYLLRAITHFVGGTPQVEPIAQKVQRLARAVLTLPVTGELYPYPGSRKYQSMLKWLTSRLDADRFDWSILCITAFTGSLGQVMGAKQDPAQTSQDWIDEWLLKKVIKEELENMSFSPAAADYGVQMVRLLVGQQGWYKHQGRTKQTPAKLVNNWLDDLHLRALLKVNTYDEVEWFNQEAMESWLWWVLAAGTIEVLADDSITDEEKPAKLVKLYDMLHTIRTAVEQSEYRVKKLLKLLKTEPRSAKK